MRYLFLGIALLCAGCGRAATNTSEVRSSAQDALLRRIGATCAVQIRRDALGMAANLPASPLTDGINGAEMTVRGTLKAVSDRWIVLTDQSQDFVIATDSILLIEFDAEPPQKK